MACPETLRLTPARFAIAIAAGLILATLPFWRFLPIGAHAPHMDHEPRHGGQLGMAGDHHIEIVRRGGRVEVYVSDALRRPVRPKSGVVVFDQTREAALAWDEHRMVTDDQPAAIILEARIELSDETRLALSFDFSD